MPLTPDEFLRFARSLDGRTTIPTGEVCWRVITGRAYHAAFLASRDAMQATHGIPAESHIKHEDFTQGLAKYNADPLIRDIGVKLDRMRLRRVDADYKLRRPFPERKADDTLDDAQFVFDNLPTARDRFPPIRAV